MLGSKEIDTINSAGIYDTYKDLYVSKKEREETLLQGIQSVNSIKAWLDAKNADDTSLTVTTQENTIKKTLGKRFAILLDFDFFKHPYGLKEDLIVRLELNFSEKVILCIGDNSATYKLSEISLEHDEIFDEPYA